MTASGISQSADLPHDACGKVLQSTLRWTPPQPMDPCATAGDRAEPFQKLQMQCAEHCLAGFGQSSCVNMRAFQRASDAAIYKKAGS